MSMGRTAERTGIDLSGRLQLVETDLDVNDQDKHEIRDQLKSLGDAMDARLGKIMWALVGMTISIATSCVVGTLLLIGGHK